MSGDDRIFTYKLDTLSIYTILLCMASQSIRGFDRRRKRSLKRRRPASEVYMALDAPGWDIDAMAECSLYHIGREMM